VWSGVLLLLVVVVVVVVVVMMVVRFRLCVGWMERPTRRYARRYVCWVVAAAAAAA